MDIIYLVGDGLAALQVRSIHSMETQKENRRPKESERINRRILQIKISVSAHEANIIKRKQTFMNNNTKNPATLIVMNNDAKNPAHTL